ncbi:MAG: PDZ domain-containing protein, partial [Mogibacterium sp.]|nr:PDZ domain-containing protein [Mogibacterium sp.]
MTGEEKDLQKTQDGETTAPKVTLGLELSDVDAYHVNDGVTEESRDAIRTARNAKREARSRKRTGAGGRIGMFLLGVLFCAGIMLLCTQVLGLGHFITDKKYDYYTDLDSAYGKYYEIMKMIGEDPIAETVPQDIDDDELKEIVAGIGDPYAEYFTAEEYEEFQKRYLGDYVGIGIGVIQEDENIVIRTVFEDTPAAEADIQEGDIIVK